MRCGIGGREGQGGEMEDDSCFESGRTPVDGWMEWEEGDWNEKRRRYS